jgi:sulfur relay (sulfurtransferase) complex TusBCD TusD component (DsrE family)
MATYKLGMMLSSPPNHPNIRTVLQLSRTALQGGHEVYLYLIDEGTRALENEQLQALKSNGLKLFVCAYGAQRQGIEPNDRAVFCGLVVLSDIIKGCDRFLAFN